MGRFDGETPEAVTASRRPVVVFVCVHNAGRSQMAAGWLRHLGGGHIDVRSGGSMPAEQVNPGAVAAMAEVGIDIAGEQPRRFDDAMFSTADVVVTMGCGDTCPFVPGVKYEDWPVPDPAGLSVEAIRPIRDEIKMRVEVLLAALELSRVGTRDPS